MASKYRLSNSRAVAPESAIQRAIIDYCEKILRALVIRNNSGVMPRANKDGSTRYVHFGGGKGAPDLIVLLPGKPADTAFRLAPALFIEVKAADGRLSPEQQEWQRRVTELGHAYLIARSVDDVAQWAAERVKGV